MSQKEIPVLLLTGYLGAGKTTLLNRILANDQGIRFAVIVNDIGEVNIDATLIQKGGIVGQDKDSADLIALQNGCICCNLRGDLVEQLSQIINTGQFDYIVIEASGICEPEPIAQTIDSFPALDPELRRGGTPVLDAIVTVVDALRLADEFRCGGSLRDNGAEENTLENLIVQQIEFCNIVVLNKISEVTPQQAQEIKAIIKAIQPQARIIKTDYAQIPLDQILNTHLFNYAQVATSATWVQGIEKPLAEIESEHHHEEERHHHHETHHHEEEPAHERHHHHEGCHCHECTAHSHSENYGIDTFVFYTRPGFDITKFDRLLSSSWPKEIIRSKGVIYFKHNRDMSYLFETAGKQKKLTEAGLWFATAPADELARFMETEPGLAADWDPEYGDRMIKLVIIGHNMDKEAITKALQACT